MSFGRLSAGHAGSRFNTRGISRQAFSFTSSLLFLCAGSLALIGCGGGGGGGANGGGGTASAESFTSTPSVVTAPPPAPAEVPGTSRFIPNYAPEVDGLRRWDKPTVTVYVGASPAGSRDLGVLVRQGGALWQGPLSGRMNLEFTDNPNADITVGFELPEVIGNNRAGKTSVTFRANDNVIQSAQVVLDRTLTDEYLVQVAAHEIGHALGIDGHSKDTADLMYPVAHLPAQLTTRDANTLLLNYDPQAVQAIEQQRSEKPGAAGQTTTVEHACCRNH